MRKKSVYVYVLSGLMGMTSIGYSDNINTNEVPASYSLHDGVLDQEFNDKVTKQTYHKNELDRLLSMHEGHLWLRSTEGKAWLVSHVGHNWFLSNSSVVNDWLDTEDAKAWMSEPQGEKSMTAKVNSLSDQKALNLNYPDTKGWPNFSTILGYGVSGVGGVAGYKYYDGGVKQKLGAGTAMAIAGLAVLQVTQSAFNACTSFQSPLDKVLITKAGQKWLYTKSGIDWLLSPQGSQWLTAAEGQDRLSLLDGNKNGHSVAKDIIHNENINEASKVAKEMEKVLLEKVKAANTISGYWYASDLDQFLSTYVGGLWLASDTGIQWLQTYDGSQWQVDSKGEMRSIFIQWLNKNVTLEFIKNSRGLQDLILEHIENMDNHDDSNFWYYDSDLSQFISSKAAGVWLTTKVGKEWMQSKQWQNWLNSVRNGYVWEHAVIRWLNTPAAKEWINSENGKSQFEQMYNQLKNQKCQTAVKNTRAGKIYFKEAKKPKETKETEDPKTSNTGTGDNNQPSSDSNGAPSNTGTG
uniref:hypothetical protein n=1 Tax=unclassified Cysteiniphilum TaxID=2610889 RepID=UPI003F82DB97